MNNTILFRERQRFKQWWIWLLLIVINGLFLFGVFKQVVLSQQFGDKPMSDKGLLITSGVMLLLTLLFVVLRLETVIKIDGIYVRFFPLQLKFRHYTWKSLKGCYVRQYSPITDYGGWGIRIGLFGKGKALNVSGTKGLQLEFVDGRKLLIGTNKANELEETLYGLGQLQE